MGLRQCCGYFGSCVLVLLSSIVLLALLTAYFKHIRTLFYVEGKCTVTTSIYTIQYSCECGRGCKSFYPCLLMYARVNSTHWTGDKSEWSVALFDNDWQQMFVVNENKDDAERCATRICYKTVQRNRDYVQRYQVDHETGSTFPCFFHPSAVVNDGAVLRKTIHWSLAVHVILWPSFGILAGISTCGYTYYWKRRKRKQYDFGDSSNAQLEDDTRITDPYNNWERY